MDSPTAWNMPLTFGRVCDLEDDHLHHGRKLSVISKVKEKARKWRQRLVQKKHVDDDNDTPSWGVALEDYEEEDLEHLGVSMYEPEHPCESCNRIAGQQPEADEVISETYILRCSVNSRSDNEELEEYLTMMSNTSGSESRPKDRENLYVPKMTTNDTVQAESSGNHQREEAPITIETLMAQRNVHLLKEKLPCPEMTAKTASSETSSAEEKEEGLSTKKATALDATDEREEKKPGSSKTMTETGSSKSNNTDKEQEKDPTPAKIIKLAVSEKLAPAYLTVSEATHKITSKIQGLSPFQGKGEEWKSDKGVLFTEYIRRNLEPGENERTSSRIISALIHPRGTPREKGLLEKVKEALTLLLQTEEPSSPSSMKSPDSSYQIPVSTNAYEVEEEHHGRILEATERVAVFQFCPLSGNST